jgi:hypothetical protein
MGVVFRAEDPQLRRPVALKVMLPKMAAAHAGRERFLREARAMAAIKHDHIIAIYQVGEDRGVPYLAMELLEGETLESRLGREGKLPVSEVLRLGHQIACGLAAAHERGLIHRDIKPSNLWLEVPAGSSTGRRLKMLDFGLARAVEEGSALTLQGMIVGTPEYMAPEQVAGEVLDHRCDLFSLGCVLYRMATGEWPFKRANVMGTLMAVTNKDPVPPCELEPAIPATLSELILQLVAKEPDKRPQSARAVADALTRIDGRAPSLRPMASSTAMKGTAFRRPTAAQMRRALVGAGIAACFLLAALSFGLRMAVPNEGVLAVNVIPSDATISVDGDIVTVTWDKGGKSAKIRLKPGTHVIEVTKNGFRMETKELTLKPLEIEVFTARLDPVGAADKSVVWTLLKPDKVESMAGTTLTTLEDGSILASGVNPPRERYTVTASTKVDGITAICLEVLTHPSLPNGGPGRTSRGNFALSEFMARVSPADAPSNSRAIVFEQAIADYSQPNWSIDGAIDGDPATAWSIQRREGNNYFSRSQAAVFVLRKPLSFPNGMVFTFTLDQLCQLLIRNVQGNHSIGRFRLSVTTSKAPITTDALPRPSEEKAVPPPIGSPSPQSHK